MDFIKEFGQIGKGDAASAGGKGASLGEMTQARIPVPPGFVILSSAFERFLNETNLNTEIDTILHSVDQREMHTVENASEKIQALILNAKMPEDIARDIQDFYTKLDTQFVAVRSSATAEDSASAAWAGQLDSFLNTTEETLLANVQKCWASLFTPRAIFYRFEKELHKTKISVAVVVQKMVQSEVSGIAFSVHPVTEDYNQLIIEAGFGLGEAIVSGSVTPDSYVIEKEPRRIIDKNITYQSRALWRAANGGNEWRELSEVEGIKPALSDEQALALAEIILRIESHYGFPCDIEWAYEAGQFFITQSRPITTLSHTEKKTIQNAVDYELTFEGQGMNFIYEFALGTYYLPPDSVSIIKKGVVQEHMSKKSLAVMDTEGQGMTAERVREAIRHMDEKIAEGRKGLEAILKEFLTAESLKKGFKLCGAVMHAYYFFDPHFWDTTYEKSKTDASAKEVVELVQNYKNKAREEFNSFYFGEGYLPRLLQKLADATGVARDTLYHYGEDELIASLSGTRISEELIATRRETFAMIKNDESQIKFLSGNEALQFSDSFFSGVSIPTTDTLKGRGAHITGKLVRGVVRLITRDYNNLARMQKEMGAMQKGEILVTQTTDPEMMPALRKASAAITDIGGMLSHTAITARELNIPCIVDTKFATQVLRDGDLVEVDAGNGIVRIIKRAEEGGKKEESEFISPALSHFPRNDYQFMGLWKCDLFAAYFWTHWFNKEVLKKLDFSLDLSGCVSLKGGNFFYHKKALRWGLNEANAMIADKKGNRSKVYRERAAADFKRLLEKTDAFVDRMPTATDFKHIIGIGEEFMAYWLTSNLMSPQLDTLIAEKAVAERVPAEDVIALIPKFPTQIDDQHADAKRLLGLLKERSLDTLLGVDTGELAEKIGRDESLVSEFDAHLQRFGWLELINYIGTPLSLERLLDQLKTVANNAPHIHEHHTDIEKLSEEFQHILRTAADIGFVRQGAAECSSVFHYKLIAFLAKTAQKIGLEYREMLNLVPEEIIAGLEGAMSRAELKELVQKRANYNWLVYSEIGAEDLVVVDEKQDVDMLHKLMVPTADKNIDTLTGQTGNKGKAQGRVSIIMATDDFPKFVEGSVLVTTMTTPDFVILMQKSVAIVTDIGGMLSHASIVSRELHKPCVIGTKFATQVLKDGDLVEVDAEKGIVRIIT